MIAKKPLPFFACALAALLSCRSPDAADAPVTGGPSDEMAALLDEFAERERARGFSAGMGLSESSSREAAGDYPGAVLAAFKELLYAWSVGALDAESLKARLRAVAAAMESRVDDPRSAAAAETARAAERYAAGDWAGAGASFSSLFPSDAEPDSFSRYLILSCALESGTASRAEKAAYAAIRSRYERFPEYWHRAARIAAMGPAAADAAERCIVLAPDGPLASEARALVAESAGLAKKDGPRILVRREIETVVRSAVAERDPGLLGRLFPLLGLPDNPYTLYALGSLRSLCADSAFRAALVSAAETERGRAAERLRYVSGL